MENNLTNLEYLNQIFQISDRSFLNIIEFIYNKNNEYYSNIDFQSIEYVNKYNVLIEILLVTIITFIINYKNLAEFQNYILYPYAEQYFFHLKDYLCMSKKLKINWRYYSKNKLIIKEVKKVGVICDDVCDYIILQYLN
jgi:hypothetical protein